MKNLLNYFFSTWISNLGVVPLFLSMFFLFEPAFFNLFFLLVLVCVVFEDISVSLSSFFNKIYRSVFLTLKLFVVKIFLPLFIGNNVYAGAHNPIDHFMSKGEQLTIRTENLDNYSIGNKEVIKHKYYPTKKQLLIKANSIGFSDLVLWEKKSKKVTHRFYISSKREQLKKLEFAQMLEGTNLSSELKGNLFIIKGKVRSRYDLLILNRLNSKKNINILNNTSIDKDFRNQLISQIYTAFYQTEGISISCEENNRSFQCFYQSKLELPLHFRKFEALGITFNPESTRYKSSNYNIQFKIISVEFDNQNQNSFGFDNLSASLSSTLNTKSLDLATSNILFNSTKTKAQIIANPALITTLNQNFNIELGTQIPFRNTQKSKEEVSNTSRLDWKFVGLKFTGHINIKNDQMLLKFKNQLTTPTAGKAISGPKNSSSLYIHTDKFIKLFEINMKTHLIDQRKIPILGNITFLKHLFTTANTQFSNKKIFCYVKIQRKS